MPKKTKTDGTKKVDFCLRDKVVWDTERFPKEMVYQMKSQYGEGPFRVVGLRVVSVSYLSDQVTIETGDGIRHEFSGDWFKRA